MTRKRVFEVQSSFPSARRALRRKFANANQATKYVSLSKATLNDLFKDHIGDNLFMNRVQRTVIDHIYPNTISGYYPNINKIIEANRSEVESIEGYTGRYRYFRNNIQGHLVSGAIIIYADGDTWKFNHYNHDIDQPEYDPDKPDHTGFVFAIGDRLNLMGIGPRYLRPIVATKVSSLSDHYIDGVVIAVKAGDAMLFAARFVMIHETHPDFRNPRHDVYQRRIEGSNRLTGVLVGTAL